jgi:hypothetical protein
VERICSQQSRSIAIVLLVVGAASVWCSTPRVKVQSSIYAAWIVVSADSPITSNEPTQDWKVSGTYTLPGGRSEPLHPFVWVPSLQHFAAPVVDLEPGEDIGLEIHVTTALLDTTIVSRFQTLNMPVPPRTNTPIFVSPNGTGNGNSADKPTSVQDALQRLRPGTTIRFEEGVYHLGGLQLEQHASEELPIVLEGVGNVVFSGWNTTQSQWHNIASTLWSTSVPTEASNTNCVVMNGRRLFPYIRMQDLANRELGCILGTPQYIGLPGFWRDPRPSTVVPFYPNNPQFRQLIIQSGDSSFDSTSLHFSVQQSCLTIRNSEWITIRGIRFEGYGVSPYGATLSINNCAKVVIDSCQFFWNDRPVVVHGKTNHVWVQRSMFYDNTDWDTFIGKSTYEPYTPALCHGLTAPALYPNNDRLLENGAMTLSHTFMGSSIYFINNTVRGMMDGLKAARPVQASLPLWIEVANNLFVDTDDAVEFDGEVTGGLFHHNTIIRSRGGISIAPALGGPLFIYRNIITSGRKGRATIEGYDTLVTFLSAPFKCQTGDTTPAGSVFIYHNTVVVDDSSEGYGCSVWYPMNFDTMSLQNNIFMSFRYPAFRLVWLARNVIVPFSMKHNLFYSTNLFPFEVFNGTSWERFATLSNLHEHYDHDFGSLFGQPEFIGESQLYTPSTTFIGKDRGLAIPGFLRSVVGILPDIGAKEIPVDTGIALGNSESNHTMFTYEQCYDCTTQPIGTTITHSIFGLSGQMIQQHTSTSLHFNVHTLPLGVYIVCSTCPHCTRCVPQSSNSYCR